MTHTCTVAMGEVKGELETRCVFFDTRLGLLGKLPRDGLLCLVTVSFKRRRQFGDSLWVESHEVKTFYCFSTRQMSEGRVFTTLMLKPCENVL